MKIDLVYNWTDVNNEDYKKSRDFWLKECKIEDEFFKFDLGLSSAKLRYSLRSAQMNAPWINHIYIITPDGNAPLWLDTSSKITMISHKDIMPESSLPTFNSYAVELCLDKIPNLSEHFLYATEEMFFTFPVKEKYFFDMNNNPYFRLRRQHWSKEIVENDIYISNLKYTFDEAKLILKLSSVYGRLEPFMGIEGFSKSAFAECRKLFAKQFEETVNAKFPQKNLIDKHVVHLYMCKEKGIVTREYPAFELQGEFDQLETMFLPIPTLEGMQEKIKNNYPKLITLVDRDDTNENDIDIFRKFMEKMFSEKQEWEKD